MTIDPPTQSCPLCGAGVHVSARYPSYVCRNCIETATTLDGQAAEIVQSHTFRSGAGLRLRSTGALVPDVMQAGRPSDGTANCLVRGVSCHAAEAHMGGIVVTLVPDPAASTETRRSAS